MRRVSALTFLLLLLWTFTVSAPAQARTAIIEGSAPLSGHSEEEMRAAVVEAVKEAVREAVAMGLTRIAFRQAFLTGDKVLVQIEATDEDVDTDEDEATGGPRAERGKI